MIHVQLCSKWAYGTDPFPAYRIELYYGRNKNDKKTIPCKVQPNEKGILPESEFSIVKTKEKGTILIVPGRDNTNRCLLMVGCSEGFRGSVDITLCEGEILSKCYAGSACDGYISVAVVLSVGQKIVFHSTGRRTNNYHQYAFDGTNVEQKVYTEEEYNQATDTTGADDYVDL